MYLRTERDSDPVSWESVVDPGRIHLDFGSRWLRASGLCVEFSIVQKESESIHTVLGKYASSGPNVNVGRAELSSLREGGFNVGYGSPVNVPKTRAEAIRKVRDSASKLRKDIATVEK